MQDEKIREVVELRVKYDLLCDLGDGVEEDVYRKHLADIVERLFRLIEESLGEGFIR